MCVVKVNRVESNNLDFSNKEPSNNSHSRASLVKNDLKAETDTHIGPQDFSGSGVMCRTPEALRQWPEATQMHHGNNESRCCSPEPQDFSTSQDCSNRVPPLEDKLCSSYHTTSTSAETEMSLCTSDSKAQTSTSSCREDTLSLAPNTDGSMDTGSENYTNNTAKAKKVETVVDQKHINPHSTTEALYDLKTEPVEGDSHTSCGSFSPSGHNCSLEKSSTEENLFPPLLQRNAVDMPQLTPEPVDKVGICPLPPVLTQEMPSLTPAHDGITDVPESTSCSHQVAPVLQRETPTDSPSSHRAKQENGETDLMMSKKPLTVEHANNWHLDSPYNCEGAAASGLEGNTAHLTANAMHKITSGGVHEMLIMGEIAAENDRTKLENVTTGQSDVSICQLVQSITPQTEHHYSLAELASKDNSEDPVQRDSALSLSRAGSLLPGISNSNPPAPSPPLCTQSDSHSALQLHHHSTYSPSHCSSQNEYMEPKPFSSSIWKNLNSHSPAVLIQSLNPELPSDFTHDPLPYTMWTEPQCKEVTDLEDPEQDLRESENQEEEGGPLTWAQLEPTSLVSVGAVEPLGLCGDYELHRRETDGSEALSLCRELGRQREAEESLHSDTAVSPHVMGEGEQDGVSDMEEGGSDGDEAEQQSSTKGESSSDSSDEEEEEEEEENDTSNYECYESGLEPGEVCAVSALSHIIIHSQLKVYTNTDFLHSNAFQ